MKQPIIIETDIGGDPDDFFAILYLLHHYDVKAILTIPGSDQQVQAVNGMLDYCKKENVQVGVPIVRNIDGKVRSVVARFLDKHPGKLNFRLSKDIIEETLNQHKDCHFFGCGPLKGVYDYIQGGNYNIDSFFMQGGYCPYSIYEPKIKAKNLIGQGFVQTFNLNGCPPAADLITDINAPIKNRYFIGKNVCHSITLGNEQKQFYSSPHCIEMELFYKYLSSLNNDKKFHDPSAAWIMRHLDKAIWVKGILFHDNQLRWRTKLDDNGYNICVELPDRDSFWKSLFNFE